MEMMLNKLTMVFFFFFFVLVSDVAVFLFFLSRPCFFYFSRSSKRLYLKKSQYSKWIVFWGQGKWCWKQFRQSRWVDIYGLVCWFPFSDHRVQLPSATFCSQACSGSISTVYFKEAWAELAYWFSFVLLCLRMNVAFIERVHIAHSLASHLPPG